MVRPFPSSEVSLAGPKIVTGEGKETNRGALTLGLYTPIGMPSRRERTRVCQTKQLLAVAVEVPAEQPDASDWLLAAANGVEHDACHFADGGELLPWLGSCCWAPRG